MIENYRLYMKNLIIHHVFRFQGNSEWIIAYEVRGEWKPRNALLSDLILNDFPVPNNKELNNNAGKVSPGGIRIIKPLGCAASEEHQYQTNEFVNGLLLGGTPD